MYKKIKILCKEKGISVHALEREIGLGGGTISRWQYSNPGFETVQKVANYFGVSIDFLSGIEKDKENTRTERIFQKISNLDSKHLKQLEAYLNILGGDYE